MAAEKQFENKVRAFLKGLPNQWHFKVFGNMFQSSGVPDILGCINGRLIGLEVKSSTGKASEIQKYVLGQIRNAGGYAVIVSPKNWDIVQKELIEISHGGRACVNLKRCKS